MSNTNNPSQPFPEFLRAAIESQGIKAEEVKSTRTEEVFSILATQGDMTFAVTFQKFIVKGGEAKWFKIFDGRDIGDEKEELIPN